MAEEAKGDESSRLTEAAELWLRLSRMTLDQEKQKEGKPGQARLP